jgi:hypothetical protein
MAARESVRFVEGFETDLAMNQGAHVLEVLLEAGQAGHISGRHDADIGEDIGSNMLAKSLKNIRQSSWRGCKSRKSSRRQLNDYSEVVTVGKQVKWWLSWVQGNAPCGSRACPTN